jgi:hypothetical protein
VDLGVGDAAMVVDHGVDERVAHLRVVVSVLRFAGGCCAVAVALLAAHEPPPTTIRNVAQLLDVDVDQTAGMVVLVTTHWFPSGPIDMRKPVQLTGREDTARR